MQPAMADVVHRVLTRGLSLRQRLDTGEYDDLPEEQAVLRELLLSDAEAAGVADYGRDASAARSTEGNGKSERRAAPEGFLGVRYLLTCWLDELFVVDSPWSSQWNERKLELALYGTNDRAWRFWKQAELARQRASTDALEAAFLCAALGFRGELREMPDRFQEWALATRSRIAGDPKRRRAVLPELQPPVNVPPRHGRHRLRRMLLVCGATLLLLVPVITFGVITRFG